MVTIQCSWCRGTFVIPYGRRGQKCCSKRCASTLGMQDPNRKEAVARASRKDPVAIECEWCRSAITRAPSSRKRFCNPSCSAKWRMSQPEAVERSRKICIEILSKSQLKSRPDSSTRMKASNPMNNPKTVEAMRSKLIGRTFLARGGNGQPTKPQLMLSEALGWPIEHPIATSSVSSQFSSLPNCYKVDLANPDLRLAIEVDGRSHRSRKWRFLDRRKEEVLASLGWVVLRFPNEGVLDDLNGVVMEIRRFAGDSESRASTLRDVLARAMAKRSKVRKVVA